MSSFSFAGSSEAGATHLSITALALRACVGADTAAETEVAVAETGVAVVGTELETPSKKTA